MTFTLGESTVTKVHEMDLNGFTLAQLMPDVSEHLSELHPEWLPEGTVEGDRACLSVHSWLVRHHGKTILIDTGAGNDKARPQQMVLDHLSNPFLERLAALGVTPEMVDYVLHTHVHSDHVGWNTRWVEGQWRPTFPNAITICSRREWEYGVALTNGDEAAIAEVRATAGLGIPVRIPVSGTFADSMRPLEPTGRVRLIEVDGGEVLPGIRFLPTPGHSIDHAAIELTESGKVALFGGDVMHHPLELYQPDLVSTFCEFPGAARVSRRRLLDYAVEQNALYCSAHLPSSSAGKVTKDQNGLHWNFVQEIGES